MISCSQALEWISLYIDGELSPQQMAEVEAHFHECDSCRLQFDQLRAVSDDVRAARPLYEPSGESTRRIQKMVRSHAQRAWRRRYLPGAAVVAIVLFASLFWSWSRGRADSFSDFATGSHIRYANGATPLDIVSARPEQVSQWLGQRLPFQFKLPDYVNQPGGEKKYSLIGARLLQYRDSDVAYLAYAMNKRPISLLVASAKRLPATGGQTFRTGGIDFHFSYGHGLRLIAWSDRGLSYALVSDVDVTGAQSCVICHGSVADRRKIEAMPR